MNKKNFKMIMKILEIESIIKLKRKKNEWNNKLRKLRTNVKKKLGNGR